MYIYIHFNEINQIVINNITICFFTLSKLLIRHTNILKNKSYFNLTVVFSQKYLIQYQLKFLKFVIFP